MPKRSPGFFQTLQGPCQCTCNAFQCIATQGKGQNVTSYRPEFFARSRFHRSAGCSVKLSINRWILYTAAPCPPPHIVRYTRYTCRMFQASESWVSNHNSLCCDAWGLCKLPKIIDIFLKCLKDKPFQLRNMQKKNRVTLVNLNIHSKRPRECSHKKCNSFFPFLHLCASTHGRCKANHIRLPQSKWCNQRDVAVQFLLSWLLYILIFY